MLLALDEGCELAAQVTSDSVRQLGLSPGREVIALVKAPAIFLLTGDAGRTSVGNHLTGIISRIDEGPVSAEVVVDLPLQRMRHVTAVVVTHALVSLGLSVGSTVTAAFQSSDVVLATFD